MTNYRIEYERGDARTRASITFPGDLTITADWGTGDLQATRNLAQVLGDRLGDVSELLQASDQRLNRILADMRPLRQELRDTKHEVERLTYEVEAATKRNEGLQNVINTREKEIAAILDRLDRGTVDLLVELVQLRVQADGGRQAAVEQMLKDAVAQREKADAEAAALRVQVETLKDHNKLINDDLRRAEEKAASPDPWYDESGVDVEWATRHTLTAEGAQADPVILNMGTDQARALESYHQWHAWGMSDRVRIELVRRVNTRGQWIGVPVPETEEVNDERADDSADLRPAGER